MYESAEDLTSRIQGEGVEQGKSLPFLPKALPVGKFPSFSKPKVFQAHSYEVQDPLLVIEPPPLNPSFREVVKQGSALPTSHVVSLQTLEGWEHLARAGIQTVSHSELFLCGVLSALSEPPSEERQREVTKYLQVMATAQSHTLEILTRLAAGPTLARRDAYLARSCLDESVKSSLRVQPIECNTLFGPQLLGSVQSYKDDIAHKSLQRVAASPVPKPRVSKPKVKPFVHPVAKVSSVTLPTGGAPPSLPNLVITKPAFKKKAGQAKRGRKGSQR